MLCPAHVLIIHRGEYSSISRPRRDLRLQPLMKLSCFNGELGRDGIIMADSNPRRCRVRFTVTRRNRCPV
jgi:hypothetical protein